MYTKILRVLCVLLLILLAFIIGVSINFSKKPTLIDGAKQTVVDFMHQPKAADMRNVKFYSHGSMMGHKVIGDVCGEVFTFKDDLPYKYKRFIVEVAANHEGQCVFSIPLFDFEGEMISEPDFQKIWDNRCQ
ncbi:MULTISPECIES: hypothetical protein [Providencia]|uniref:Uncharacterized protein n=1 Tax=Providencia rettgeri TaxID=587 RepID=A0AB35L6A5_PRORE|nr:MULTISPECIES: hypothetical protein [Providencia]AWS51892.1 hypothetical protein AM461_14240 [Providencia rettgeri]EHZ7766081.1 hypothetical protein [Providencia rettgeri]EIJ7169223.1 hypothetical protein [Providencia rettgeri]EJD6047247.1 hypothetical protein [Providencia rettgeri]EJD6474643.1 hypothetical protein [Providencia rettgeri]